MLQGLVVQGLVLPGSAVEARAQGAGNGPGGRAGLSPLVPDDPLAALGTEVDGASRTAVQVWTEAAVPVVLPRLLQGPSRPEVLVEATLGFWDVDEGEGTEAERPGALQGSTLGAAAGGRSGRRDGAVDVFGALAITRVEPDDGEGASLVEGRLGADTVLGDGSGDGASRLGAYGELHQVDAPGESRTEGGAGVFAGLSLDLDPVVIAGGALAQLDLGSRDLPDGDTDWTASVAYGAGVGTPLGDVLAVNVRAVRLTAFRPEGDASFTTLIVAGDVAVSPHLSLQGTYRKRFEIDRYDATDFGFGFRFFLD